MRLKYLVWVLCFLVLASFTSAWLDEVHCTFKSSCNPATETSMFELTDLDGGHIAYGGSNVYANKFCCTASFVATSAVRQGYVPILHLSSPTDAHVEKYTESNYGNGLFVAFTSFTHETIVNPMCNYRLVCDDLCLASISDGDTDLHIGDCDAYDQKICCTPCQPTSENCEDEIDNDCDGLVDELDIDDCYNNHSYIEGYVWNKTTGDPITNAELSLYWNGNKLERDTDSTGFYEFDNLGAREYLALFASAPGVESAYVEDISVDANERVSINFSLEDIQQLDCHGCSVFRAGKMVCDSRCLTSPECDSFYFKENMEVCEGKVEGAPVYVGGGYLVYCCDGELETDERTPLMVESTASNLITTEKSITIAGRPYKLVMVTYQK